MSEPAEKKCEVCDGRGDYLIFNKHGRELYFITCPECYGSGEADEPEIPEPSDWPPPSTAAGVKSLDEMRAYLRWQWPSPTP